MKNLRIASIILLLFTTALLFSCGNTAPDGGTAQTTEEVTTRPAEPYFTVYIPENANFVAGDILLSSKDPEADYTVESFPEIECESIRLLSRSEKDSCWSIKLKTKTRQATVAAIKKLAWRSDLNFAEPNYLIEAN